MSGTRRAFDVYSAELVRDDEMICAATEVYFVRIDDPDTRYEPHQPTLHLSEKTDRARLPSRTAGGWRDFMDLDRPTGRGTDG